jgi:uncharacterized membrane protein YeiH
VATFRWHRTVRRLRRAIVVLDAAGLALFAVSGALKALAFGLNPVGAVVLGMVTGIGGGMVREILVGEVPSVLKADLYAVAALAGAAVVVTGSLLGLATAPVVIGGAALCFGLRVAAIRRGWSLPIATPSGLEPANDPDLPPDATDPPGRG